MISYAAGCVKVKLLIVIRFRPWGTARRNHSTVVHLPFFYLLPLPYFLPFAYLASCRLPSSSTLFLVLRLFGFLSLPSSSTLFLVLRLFGFLSPTFFLYPISCPSPIWRPVPFLLLLPSFLSFAYLASCDSCPLPWSSTLFLVLRLFGVLSPTFFLYPVSCPSPICRLFPYIIPLHYFLTFAYLASCPLPSSLPISCPSPIWRTAPTFFVYPIPCHSPIWRPVPYFLLLHCFLSFAYLASCPLPSPSSLFIARRLFGVLSPTFSLFPISCLSPIWHTVPFLLPLLFLSLSPVLLSFFL